MQESYGAQQIVRYQTWLAHESDHSWSTAKHFFLIFTMKLVHEIAIKFGRSMFLDHHTPLLKVAKVPLGYGLECNFFNWQHTISFCWWTRQNQPSNIPLTHIGESFGSIPLRILWKWKMGSPARFSFSTQSKKSTGIFQIACDKLLRNTNMALDSGPCTL